MIKRLAGFIVIAVVVLLAICVVRALLLRPRDRQHASITTLPIDAEAAIARFSGAIRIQTISQPLAKPDQPAMMAFGIISKAAFPTFMQQPGVKLSATARCSSPGREAIRRWRRFC